jgi:hypothetical protein
VDADSFSGNLTLSYFSRIRIIYPNPRLLSKRLEVDISTTIFRCAGVARVSFEFVVGTKRIVD